MTTTDFAKELKSLKSAVIFCHVRPDGDTLSCAFALYYAFTKLGKPCMVVTEEPLISRHKDWVPFGPSNVPDQSYDGFICVDTPTLQLLGKNSQQFMKHKKRFSIDHHPGRDNDFVNKYYFDLKPACTMLCYDIIQQMGVEIDKNIATLILTGLMTDTDNFSIQGLGEDVFELVAELIRLGANHSQIYDQQFRNTEKQKAQLFGRALQKIKYFHNDKLAIITTTCKDLEECNADQSMTLGFVEYLLTIKSVDVAVSLLEAKNGMYRASFRSKSANVSQIAQIYGGGGHEKASGAVLFGYYEDIIDKLVFDIGNYLLW